MRFHHLMAVVAIADKGSFTSGARHLKISQSSFSHTIADLERELGVSLFVRDRQGAHPTEIGHRILPLARQALATLDSIRTVAGETQGVLCGRVRIGSIPSTTVSFLPRVIAHFTRKYPKVEVVLLEEPSQGMQQLADWLRGDAIDLAILELPMNDLKVMPLMQDELCAIVAKNSAFARLKRVSVVDLAVAPFVKSRYCSERLIQAAFGRHNVSPLVRFEVQDLGTLVSMVREGLGVSVVPRVAFSATPPGVVLVPLFPRIRRELGFALRSTGNSARAVSAFVLKLQELGRDKRLRSGTRKPT